MTVRLRNLNESLERLYESQTSLDEAFGDSFPKWLKDRLAVSNLAHPFRDTANTRINHTRSSKGYGWRNDPVPPGQRPEYSHPKGGGSKWEWNSEKERELSLFQNALNAGIDLQNAEIIEGEIPTTRTDVRLKEPNLPIWGFPNGQVYIPGLNDREIYQGNGKAFVYAPLKTLMNDANHFAYIDSSSFDPSEYQKKKAQRKGLRDEVVGIDNNDPTAGAFRPGHDSSQFKPFERWRDQLDKSGYIVRPDRYEDALKKAGANKILQTLQDIYDRIIEVKEDIAAAASYIDPFEDAETYKRIGSFFSILDSVITEYNDYSRTVERISKQYNNGDITQEEYQYYMGNYYSKIKNCREFKQLKNLGDDVFLAGVDWLE